MNGTGSHHRPFACMNPLKDFLTDCGRQAKVYENRYRSFAVAMACLFVIFFSGCSRESWLAKFHVVRAEEMFTKAYELRSKKDQQGERLKLYRRSCDHFLQAHRLDPKVFTLYRIEMAYQACRWVEDEAAAETLREFEEEYAAAHPTEVEFGDAMPPPLEG